MSSKDHKRIYPLQCSFFSGYFSPALNLGDFPLTDHEASLAMQAQQIT